MLHFMFKRILLLLSEIFEKLLLAETKAALRGARSLLSGVRLGAHLMQVQCSDLAQGT